MHIFFTTEQLLFRAKYKIRHWSTIIDRTALSLLSLLSSYPSTCLILDIQTSRRLDLPNKLWPRRRSCRTCDICQSSLEPTGIFRSKKSTYRTVQSWRVRRARRGTTTWRVASKPTALTQFLCCLQRYQNFQQLFLMKGFEAVVGVYYLVQ